MSKENAIDLTITVFNASSAQSYYFHALFLLSHFSSLIIKLSQKNKPFYFLDGTNESRVLLAALRSRKVKFVKILFTDYAQLQENKKGQHIDELRS